MPVTKTLFGALLKKAPKVGASEEAIKTLGAKPLKKIVDKKLFRRQKKLLTVGGATLAGVTAADGIFDEDAEAGMLVSSAAKRLIGSLFQGKAITNVLKGKGQWRYLVFEDGTQQVVDKKMITALSREVGTKEKVGEFILKDTVGKSKQAKKSFEMHLRRSGEPITPRAFTKAKHGEFLEKLGKAKITPVERVEVEAYGKLLFMPKQYAETLEKQGLLKIRRPKK